MNRTPFLAGRPFSDDESRSRAAVGILSVSAARYYFPNRVEQRISETIGPASVTLTHVPDRLEPGLQDPRFRAVLFSTLALAALLLAAIGLYAVTSFEVALRRYEMAVRLSLGARGPDIHMNPRGEPSW